MQTIPHYKRTVRPSNPARLINGKIVKPISGIDWLLFGVIKKGEK